MNVGFGLSAAVLVAAFVFGGGASLASPGDLLPQVLSLPLLYHAFGSGWARLSEARLIRLWLVGVLILFGLQLLPLPPSLWAALPGREAVRAMIGVAGEPGWMSLSLRPPQTVKAFLGLLPPVALFFGVLTLDLKRRVWLLALLIGLVLLSVTIGLLQLVNGPDSSLYFYQFTTSGRAVGFFANPNHFVAPLYATLPLVAALMSGRSGRHAGLMAAGFGGIAFAYLVGLSTSGARTAVLLGGASLALALFGVARRGTLARLSAGRPLLGAGALAGLLVTPVLLGVGLITILERFDRQDVFDDLRWTILPAALDQGLSYFPFGAGMGTFDRAYALQEGVATLMPSYINHVHNDWAEVFFEAGAAGVALMALGLIIVVRMSYQAVVCPPGLAGRLLAGGVLGIWLLLAHSLWDYPLRTQACLAVLALALALGVPATEANVMSLQQAWPWARRRKSGRSKSRGDTSGGDTSGGGKVPGADGAAGGVPAV